MHHFRRLSFGSASQGLEGYPEGRPRWQGWVSGNDFSCFLGDIACLIGGRPGMHTGMFVGVSVSVWGAGGIPMPPMF